MEISVVKFMNGSVEPGFRQLDGVSEELLCIWKKHSHNPASRNCPPDFDKVLCWPETVPNSLAILPCFEELNGIHYDTSQNASRACLADGTWSQSSNYSACNEMTLLDEMEVQIVTTIYFIGYMMSLVALSVAVYIFWKYKDLRCLRNTIHMNLMCSYFLADFMWILIYTLQLFFQTDNISCIILILLLHYFHLTNFFWMFVEGLYLYIIVVKTFRGDHIRLSTYASLGWGGPLLFIMFWGIAKSLTLPPEDQHTGMIVRSCPWTPHAYDWIFQGPAITVLLVNVVFLCIIMWVLITKLQSANNVETQQYRKAAKALLVLIPLLGVTYVLVLVGPEEGLSRSIYDYIRAVLISTQGFTVALFYCFLNAEVKNTLGHHFSSWNTRRSLSSRRTRYGSGSASGSFRDWTSQARDSLRMYYPRNFYKRGSTGSEGTTTTVVAVPYPPRANNNVKNGVQTSVDAG